jgi:hypothetical protein
MIMRWPLVRLAATPSGTAPEPATTSGKPGNYQFAI